MTIGHLALFGFVEGLVTALVVRYLQKAESQFLTIYGGEYV
jgi:ABC-type Co2+ transport system permease subunit